MKHFLLSFLLLYFHSFSFSQDYIVDVTHYGMEDGLSHNQINWVHKDHRGIIWVGANNGINRFDGKEFKLVAEVNFFRSENRNIFEDHEGDLWIEKSYPKGELMIFNTLIEKEKSFEEKFGANVPFLPNEYVRGVWMPDSTIVIGTNTGQLIFYDKNKNWETRSLIGKQKVNYVSPHYSPESGRLWISIFHYDMVNSKSTNWSNTFLLLDKNQNIEHQLYDEWAEGVAGITKEGNLLYHTNSYIKEIFTDGHSKPYYISHFINSQVSSFDYQRLAFDATTNHFWLSNNFKTNLLIFSKDGKELIYLNDEFKELNVTEYFEWYLDGDEYWLGSINGLFKIRFEPKTFKKVLYQDPEKSSQSDFFSCRGIASDVGGNIYISNRHSFANVKNNGEINTYVQGFGGYKIGAFVDNKNNIYTSSRDQLYRIDAKTAETKTYELPYRRGFNTVWSFFQDDENRIWLGTVYGIYTLEENADSIKLVIPTEGEGKEKSSYKYSIFQDAKRRIWVPTDYGLLQVDRKKGIIARYHEHSKTHFLPASTMRHIHQDKEGVFWIASIKGLIRWNEEENETQLFTVKNGFSHNSIYSVYEDDFGFLWMSSDNGIMQFHKESHQVKIYLPSDGITHREFNRISHHQAKDGMIYFGGLNGVTAFHPKDFKENFNAQPDIPLLLTEAEIFSGKTHKEENIINDFRKNGKIVIAPSDRFLKLKFALLDYENSEFIKYTYAIDDEKEYQLGADNSLNLGSLPYGNHTITIRGITANGLFSKQELQIPVEVLKPFYLQWWFVGLSIFTLAGLIVFYQKRKTQQLLQQQEELEKTVQERTHTISKQAEELREMDKAKSRFLANISHEFRTPLTLILNTLEEESFSKVVDSQDFTSGKFFAATEVNIMQRNTKRLQTLIDQLLDLSKLEAKKMKLETASIDFFQYLKNTVTTFEGLAKKQNIQIQFLASLEKIELFFDRDKMDKIIYNLLGNAIKFTPEGGLVTIHLQKIDGRVFLKVKDSGIGITSNDLPNIFDRFYQVNQQDEFAFEGTGLGLALVKELTELHHGAVSVESQLGEGTTFTLEFLLGKNHLRPEEIISTAPIQEVQSSENELATIKKETPNQSIDSIASTEKPILLIIEDNEDLRYHHNKMFSKTYQVFLAKDGIEGLELAYTHIPDLIVCDVMMPRKNGYEVCQELKSDQRTNHIPLLLLTARAEQNEKIKGLQLGANGYLVKPYHQEELSLRLQNLYNQTQQLRSQFQVTVSPEIATEEVALQNPFVVKIYEVIEDNYADSNFSVEELANSVRLSRSQLFRKLKALTGETPTNLIRTYRLEKGKMMLENFEGNASEIAYQVGFNNPTYFHKCFKNEFGMTPKEFVNAPM